MSNDPRRFVFSQTGLKMADAFPEELLSAYLDGELPPEERERVEQHLVASADARRLVEELRALGRMLRELPQFELDDEFHARVLRHAEREMLRQPAASPTETSRTAQRTFPWNRIARPLVYAGAAVAAAFLIMFVTREPHAPVAPVARSVPHASPAAAQAPAPESKPIMLVEVDVIRQAAEGGAFDALLARQNIKLDVNGDGMHERSRIENESDTLAGQVQSRASTALPSSARPAEPIATQLYYVNTTPSQLAGTLEQIQLQTQQFRAVRVEPDPQQPLQKAFERFNWGAVKSQDANMRSEGLRPAGEATNGTSTSDTPAAPSVEELQRSGRGLEGEQLGSARGQRLDEQREYAFSKDDSGKSSPRLPGISRAKRLSEADTQAVLSDLYRQSGDRKAQKRVLIEQLKELKSTQLGSEQRLALDMALRKHAPSQQPSDAPPAARASGEEPLDVLFLVNVIDAEDAAAKPEPPAEEPK